MSLVCAPPEMPPPVGNETDGDVAGSREVVGDVGEDSCGAKEASSGGKEVSKVAFCGGGRAGSTVGTPPCDGAGATAAAAGSSANQLKRSPFMPGKSSSQT